MKTDQFIRWVVLVAALTSTAYAEHHLGVWLGWSTVVAGVIPAVADLYLIYATRAGRDIAPAVSVVIGLSAANYVCTAPLDTVRTPLSVAVSSLAPLVLWRLHVNHSKPAEPEPEPVVEVIPDPIPTVEAAPEPETVAEEAPKPEPVVEEEPEHVRLSDEEAKRMAEHAYVNGVSAAKAAEAATRSPATVYRWYKQFETAGVKRLVHA